MNFSRYISIAIICACSHAAYGTYREFSEELKTTSDPERVHRLKAQIAAAAVQRLETEKLSKTEQKKLRAEIRSYCADVQLGAMDLWYGKAVVTWGRLMLLDGPWQDARAVMLDQAEVLQNIEKNLTAHKIPISSISPVAGARYLLGETYRLEYETLQTLDPAVKALKHFYNVYIKYGDSPWGESSREKAEAAQAFIERQGRRVRIELGSHRIPFMANQFKLGARRMAEGKFKEAIEPLERAINYFPETEQTMQALHNLAVCKQVLGFDDEALMMAEYCVERFSAHTNTPRILLGLGRRAIDAHQEKLASRFFNLYLAAFPEHEKRGDIFSWFAWKAYQAEDWERAADFFQSLEIELRKNGEAGERLEKAVYIQAIHPVDSERVDAFLAEFPRSEWGASALSKKAQALLVAGDFEGAFQTLEQLEHTFSDAPAAKNALSDFMVAAVDAGRFDVVEQVLNRLLFGRKVYGSSAYLSAGDGLLKVGKFDLAEKAFGAVPLSAKKSSAERARFGTASCQFGRLDFGVCFQTLEQLIGKFPTTGMFYEVRLMQARCLVQLGRMDEAVAAYADVSSRGDYAVTFEMAGVLADAEQRLAAYQRIALLADPARSENRPLIADSILASLPICMELEKFELALRSCEQFEALFPEHGAFQTLVKYRTEAAHALAN
ncbi:MAG: tetratricopeptide repeat protein [Pontiella sp.]